MKAKAHTHEYVQHKHWAFHYTCRVCGISVPQTVVQKHAPQCIVRDEVKVAADAANALPDGRAAYSNGDTGCPSMLEELARGIPGSFVAMAAKPELSSSVGSVISVVQSEPEKKFTTEGTEMQPVNPELGRYEREMRKAIDGGFIMGPGLDDQQRVVGAFVGREEQRHGAPSVACGDTSPCGGEAPSDHRAYDAAVKAEAEKNAEAFKVRSLLRAWSLITAARQLLRDVDATEMSNAAQRAGGFVRIDREKPECRLCGRPRCKHRREVIEAVTMTADGKVLCLTVEV